MFLSFIINTISWFILLILVLVLSRYIYAYLNARKNNGEIKLEAIKTHNNRTLSFTKNKIYTFYKSGDMLILNEDDLGYRDNFSFYRDDIDSFFISTDLFSKLVLENINFYNRRIRR